MAEGERRKSPARWLLIAPLALALLLGLGLTAFWWTAKQRVEQQLDQLAAADAGISWQSRRVSGWPFRLKVTLVEPRLRGPGQLAFGAPELTAQAYLYRLDHWNAAAPRGLTLIRPEGGPVAITGRAIRASVTDASSAPRFDMQGLNLTFRPAPRARPVSHASAERMEVHWRPRPGAPQEAAFYVSLDGGKAAPATFADFMARGAPIAFVWDARVSHADTFDGATWPQAARAWAEAGG